MRSISISLISLIKGTVAKVDKMVKVTITKVANLAITTPVVSVEIYRDIGDSGISGFSVF